jgi:hypothetical protein
MIICDATVLSSAAASSVIGEPIGGCVTHTPMWMNGAQ